LNITYFTWVSRVSGAASVTEHNYMMAPLAKSYLDRGLVVGAGEGERFWKLFIHFLLPVYFGR